MPYQLLRLLSVVSMADGFGESSLWSIVAQSPERMETPWHLGYCFKNP